MFDWLKNKLHAGGSDRQDVLKNAYPSINAAAGELLAQLGPSFTGTTDGHIQTDIAAAASLAGSVLLRDVVRDVERHPAGQVILSDTHEQQHELFGFMAGVAPGMGLNASDGWVEEVPKQHEPLFDVAKLVGKLQGSLIHIVARHGVPEEFRAHIPALAAMKLVAAGHDLGLLDQRIGKALASYYLVAGSKTVPPPLTQS